MGSAKLFGSTEAVFSPIWPAGGVALAFAGLLHLAERWQVAPQQLVWLDVPPAAFPPPPPPTVMVIEVPAVTLLLAATPPTPDCRTVPPCPPLQLFTQPC